MVINESLDELLTDPTPGTAVPTAALAIAPVDPPVARAVAPACAIAPAAIAPAVAPVALPSRGRKRTAPDEPDAPEDSHITERDGVRILHHFATSHHFKGPHDAYGKDPKFLGRMAERHQRVRLATTRDLYNFCVETMPEPKKLTAKQIIAPMPIRPPAELARLPPEQLPEHLRQQQPTWAEVLKVAEAVGAQEQDSTVASDDEGREEGKTEVESEPEEPEEVEPEEAEVERLEAASDSEAEEDGAGDLVFEFDENGGRIRPEEEAAHMAEEEAEMETRGAVVEQPSASRSRRRRSRQVEILQQAAGQEHTTQGETRTEQQGQRAQGIFTAQKYFWMYFAPGPNSGLQIVKPGERAGPGQCHAILDAAANLDADSVTASNETYEYAGIDASQPEMLYTKTFTCAASCCRDRSSISLDSRACPFLAFTGRWQQQTVHAMHGVTRVAAEKRVAASEFAKRMKVDHLYAVFGSYKELGDRPYWLLWCIQLPYQAPKAPNNLKAQDGSTIRGGTWIFDAYFFESTSADQQRRSYKLLDGEKVHVTVESLIQEADLEFDRDGMHDRILGDLSHLKIMRHNFSNVVT
jgi:hypothetical protein